MRGLCPRAPGIWPVLTCPSLAAFQPSPEGEDDDDLDGDGDRRQNQTKRKAGNGADANPWHGI